MQISHEEFSRKMQELLVDYEEGFQYDIPSPIVEYRKSEYFNMRRHVIGFLRTIDTDLDKSMGGWKSRLKEYGGTADEG